MTKPVPIPALLREAKTALGEHVNDSWRDEEGRSRFFTFWYTGNHIMIRIATKKYALTMDEATYQHFLNIYPRKMKAVFYRFEGLPEIKKEIRERLVARGYAVLEQDSGWFNSRRQPFADLELITAS